MNNCLEIAAFNLESAQIAARAGADRIELCSGLAEGGLTPSKSDLLAATQHLDCPVFVMIRPRGGDFHYSASELAIMEASLQEAKGCGPTGFVFGALTADGHIDEEANRRLVQLAHPLPCTFHRAFDDLTNKREALETLISCGFRRVLTSGGTGNAVDYCEVLHELIVQAGDRITVMPGGGIRTLNIAQIQRQTGATELHSAAITDGGQLADAAAVQAMKAALNA